MKKLLKLIILTLKQKDIITAKEFADLLDKTNATTTNLRRNRREKTRAKNHKGNVCGRAKASRRI